MALSGGDIKPARFNKTKAIQGSHEDSITVIQGRIFLENEPYCRASFLIEMAVSREYPFKVPSLTFLDPIYHPYVLENGKFFCCRWICCRHRRTDIPICDYLGCPYGKNWRPTKSLADLIEDTIRIIDRIPSIDLAINADCAQEYVSNYQAFYEKALELTLLYGRPRQ
jgi:ubiquitin-protein ligase